MMSQKTQGLTTKVLSLLAQSAFKKFKGHVRRERHQATTNQKTVLANNRTMFFKERPFCLDVVVGKFYFETKEKEVVFQA